MTLEQRQLPDLSRRVTQHDKDITDLANMIGKLVDALEDTVPVELVVEWNERGDGG
jgi:hypothetical protein